MYKLEDSFMEFISYTESQTELETLHIENIQEWYLDNHEPPTEDINISECDNEEGYAYCGERLITFSTNITGMVEYKVWWL